jgi:hypothetical protein
MQSARQKQGKNTHPNHDSCHCPTAAMVPSSWQPHVQQLDNMLRDKSMLLKLENISLFLLFISYFKAQCIINASSTRLA